MTAAFVRQLRWELRRLWRRPRSWIGFAACLVFEAAMMTLYRLPSVQERMLQQVWRLPAGLEPEVAISGLALAFEVTAETSVFVAALFLALVGTDVVGGEVDDGTLRMVLCRPVSRGSVLAQKLVACAVYTAALMLFIGTTALLLGLAVHGTGGLAVLVVRESILGTMDFATGLAHYALAMPFLVAGVLTVPLFAFALSCFRMKPGTAAAIALALLLADWTVRVHPAFPAFSPYCVTTRIATWRQLFNEDIPWLRIERNLRQLAGIDALLVVVAWAAFRRRPLTPR